MDDDDAEDDVKGRKKMMLRTMMLRMGKTMMLRMMRCRVMMLRKMCQREDDDDV